MKIKNKKDFVSIADLKTEEIWKIINMAKKLKKMKRINTKLKNKSLVMFFEKPSLRTKLSFEIGMTKLGGHAIYLNPNEVGLGVRESIHDVSKIISSMADIVMARTFKHKTIEELAKWSNVPVINGLSDLEHPCQALADLLTIWEIKKDLKGLSLVFIGDGENNIAHSLCLVATMFGINFTCVSPQGFYMNKKIVKKAKQIAKESGARIIETDNPTGAVINADVIYTDTWVSMGKGKEKEKRLKIFKNYQVTQKLMSFAKSGAIFMHDLPAYRGNEVTAGVIDGKQSVVFAQAENRLWAQMGLLLFLLSKDTCNKKGL